MNTELPPPAWLPGVGFGTSGPESRHEGHTVAGAPFTAPRLSAADAHAVAESVREAALAARASHDARAVVRVVSAAAMRLADPDDEHGRLALQALQLASGASAEAAGLGLRRSAEGWTPEALEGVVRSELGGLAVLDGPRDDPARPGRRRAATGPLLLHLVLAGNVPGVAVTAVIRALLVRSGVLCKLPSAEPWLVGLFLRGLAEDAPDLAATVAATWWPGGSGVPAADVWVKVAGKVVVYGGAEAVRFVREAAPSHVPLVEYGPRIGCVLLGPAVDDDELHGLATDICAYDQAGCVSPRLVYLLGGAGADPDAAGHAGGPSVLRRLGGALSEVLAGSDAALFLTDAEAVAIRAARARYEFGDGGAVALGPPDLRWTILYAPAAGTRTEPLPRVVWAYRAEAVEELRRLGSVLENRLQVLGIGGVSEDERRDAEHLAAALGVSRVTPLGAMAWPPPDWRHDGRMQLMPLLRWTDIESRGG